MTTEDDGARSARPTGPGATAEATPPTIDINWPGWLEEFYQAYQAERIAADHADLSDDDALKTAARETLAQLNGAVAAIEGTPANSQEALAVKLAVAWNYHADELPFGADATDDLSGELLLLRTSLDALAQQTGLSLFGLWDRDGHNVLPDLNNPDAGLIWLEQEYVRNLHYTDKPPLDSPSRKELPDETHGAYAERRGEIQKEVARTLAATPAGAAAKLRLLRSSFDNLSVWGEEGWKTCLTSLEGMNGTTAVAPEPETEIGTAPASPEAVLFALEVEMKAAHEGLDAAPDNNAAHEPWYQRMEAAEKAALATPAQTGAGVLAKLRMAAHYLPNVRFDQPHDSWVRNVIADAQRIGATASAATDAALQGLWREYRQNCKEWGAAADDTEAEATCAKRAEEIERRIIATPSESALGLAIKLRIAVDNTPEDEEPEFNDQRAMLAVLDDVDRLAGFSEPRRVWRAS